MIHSPPPGVDNIPSGTTSPSSSPDSHGRPNEFHIARRKIALTSQEEVRAFVRARYEDCKSWFESRGHHIEAATFEDMDEELARRCGTQDRAMLYRLYMQYSVYEKHGKELVVPEHIGDETRVLGTLGSGGAGDIYYCEPNIEMISDNARMFVREIVELPSISEQEEKIARFTPLIEKNVARLRSMRGRTATKLWRTDGPEEDDIKYERAAREMRRMIVDPSNPLYALIPTIVGGKLSRNERYFHMIYEPGVDLQTLIRASGNAISWRILSDICAYLARALKLFELSDTAHRDLTPRNILITKEGLRVLDLGTTKKVQNETADLTQGIHGTFAYMAPEQAAARADLISSKTDVYSMGHVMMAVADALAPTHYPHGFQDDRHGMQTVTHRAKQLEKWEEDHTNDAFRDSRAEWMKLRDVHVSPQLEREAAADPRVARYLESWKDKVWMMTHPIPSMRPSSSEVYAYFVRHSRFAPAPHDFLKYGTAPRQWKKNMIIDDPVDPYPFLGMLREEATASQNLRSPWGRDVLDDFGDNTTIHGHRSRTRTRVAVALLASGALGIGSGLYLWHKQSPAPEERRAPHIEPTAESIENLLLEPAMIVRPAPNPEHPVDEVIDFAEGKILMQMGHPRGFELHIDAENTMTPTSTAYCIRNESTDPSREESMMAFAVNPQKQESLESLFPEMKGVPIDTNDLNMFLFTRAGDRLVLLPRGGGYHIRVQDGRAHSVRFTTKTIPPDTYKRLSELEQTEFKGYVATKQLPRTVFLQTLQKHRQLSLQMLQQYVKPSQ